MVRQVLILGCLLVGGQVAVSSERPVPCRIEVVDKESGLPVPLVELRTTHQVRLVSDNAGLIACDLPELMGRETWFTVSSPGYEVPADGFGSRGVRLIPRPGETLRVEVTRTGIARRLGRLTGGGLFVESQKLGERLDQPESGVVGCDSVQTAVHRGRHFWLWGDTTLARYPLGIFHSSSATTRLLPFASFEPPLEPRYEYFRDAEGVPRGVARMPGDGPTWLSGMTSLPDADGAQRLVALYAKIKPPLEVYRFGLCIWNDEQERFDPLRVVWEKSDDSPQPPPLPEGHPLFHEDSDGRRWVLFGNPLPTLRCPATLEAWQDPATWEVLRPQRTLRCAETGKEITPHSGSVAWNPYRQRWVTVFMQRFGDPSAFGEIWYAEARRPTGPWGPAVKVLSHRDYSFYNPRIHPEFTPDDSPVLLFEGTYTTMFAGDRARPTPRYEYNQILYRLDLDDEALSAAMRPPQ